MTVVAPPTGCVALRRAAHLVLAHEDGCLRCLEVAVGARDGAPRARATSLARATCMLAARCSVLSLARAHTARTLFVAPPLSSDVAGLCWTGAGGPHVSNRHCRCHRELAGRTRLSVPRSTRPCPFGCCGRQPLVVAFLQVVGFIAGYVQGDFRVTFNVRRVRREASTPVPPGGNNAALAGPACAATLRATWRRGTPRARPFHSVTRARGARVSRSRRRTHVGDATVPSAHAPGASTAAGVAGRHGSRRCADDSAVAVLPAAPGLVAAAAVGGARARGGGEARRGGAADSGSRARRARWRQEVEMSLLAVRNVGMHSAINSVPSSSTGRSY